MNKPNNRFKSLSNDNDADPSMDESLPTNSRWSREKDEHSNPFRPSSLRRGSDRFQRPHDSYMRDESPPKNSRWTRDENEDDNKTPSSNYFNRRSQNRDRSSYRQRRSRFRPRDDRSSYFNTKKKSPKKPEFKLEQDDFPPLSQKNTKTKLSFGPLNFNEAAQRGQKCATPPPGPGLPPVERRERPPKHDSDEESTGWNTDDEINDRIQNPSDDEEDNAFP